MQDVGDFDRTLEWWLEEQQTNARFSRMCHQPDLGKTIAPPKSRRPRAGQMP